MGGATLSMSRASGPVSGPQRRPDNGLLNLVQSASSSRRVARIGPMVLLMRFTLSPTP
jgi:hypothetical protein